MNRLFFRKCLIIGVLSNCFQNFTLSLQDVVFPKREVTVPQCPVKTKEELAEIENLKITALKSFEKLCIQLLQCLEIIDSNIVYWQSTEHESKLMRFVHEPVKVVARACNKEQIDYFIYLFKQLASGYATAFGYARTTLNTVKSMEPSFDVVAEIDVASRTLSRWLGGSPFNEFILLPSIKPEDTIARKVAENVMDVQKNAYDNLQSFNAILTIPGKAGHFQRNWLRYISSAAAFTAVAYCLYTYPDKIHEWIDMGKAAAQKLYNDYLKTRFDDIKASLFDKGTDQLDHQVAESKKRIEELGEALVANGGLSGQQKADEINELIEGRFGSYAQQLNKDPNLIYADAALTKCELNEALWKTLGSDKPFKDVQGSAKRAPGGLLKEIQFQQSVLVTQKLVKELNKKFITQNTFFFAVVPSAILGLLGIYVAKKLFNITHRTVSYFIDTSAQQRARAVRALHGLDTTLTELSCCSTATGCYAAYGKELYYLSLLERSVNLLPLDCRVLLYDDIETIRSSSMHRDEKTAALNRIKQFVLPAYQSVS